MSEENFKEIQDQCKWCDHNSRLVYMQYALLAAVTIEVHQQEGESGRINMISVVMIIVRWVSATIYLINHVAIGKAIIVRVSVQLMTCVLWLLPLAVNSTGLVNINLSSHLFRALSDRSRWANYDLLQFRWLIELAMTGFHPTGAVE